MSRRRQWGGINKLSSGSYRARCSGPDGVRRSKVFRTKADADAWLGSQQTDARRGDWIDPDLQSRRFEVWAEAWLGHLLVRPNTRRQYEVSLRVHVLPIFGSRPVGTIARPDVQHFVKVMTEAGSAPGTVVNAKKVLRLVLQEAVAGGGAKTNVADGVKVQRGRRQEMMFLTVGEVISLAYEISNPPRPRRQPLRHYPQYGLLVRLAALSGMRAGEIAALRIGRVNFLGGTIEVAESASEAPEGLVYNEPKTYERRTVPIGRTLATELGEQIGERLGQVEGFVFTAPDGGPLRHSTFYRRHFKPAAARAGFPALRFHDLRHTAAALMISEGFHLLSVKERLGHSSFNVTYDRYGHVYQSQEEAETDRLDELFRAALDRQ